MSEWLSDYDYRLPPEQIADRPAAVRSASRLLELDRATGDIRHRRFSDLPELLAPEDLLVFNDTRVIRARLHGRKQSGGRVEVLIERIPQARQAFARIRASKSPKAGSRLLFAGGAGEEVAVEVLGRNNELFELRFEEDIAGVLERIGEVPLPPYIRRRAAAADIERYQTVYASRDGAVAAPTAGLHFDRELFKRIAAGGVRFAYLTLHVGAGTFQPVREQRISRHRMHGEYAEVPAATCAAIGACRKRGGRVVAVGTTVARALESAARAGKSSVPAGGQQSPRARESAPVSGAATGSDAGPPRSGESADGAEGLREYRGETDIFIYPGFEFRAIDALITNFHLPRSSLLMLVSAFCGSREMLLDAYREAIAEGYRFYSYGDAMFVS